MELNTPSHRDNNIQAKENHRRAQPISMSKEELQIIACV